MLKSAEDLKKEFLEEKEKEKERLRIQSEELEMSSKKRRLEEASNFINDYLPKLLHSCEKKGVRQFVYPNDCNYNYSTGIYERYFEPNTEHCNYVIEQLKKCGYTSEVITRHVSNVSFVTTADGYDIVPEPGTHEEYQLKISW